MFTPDAYDLNKEYRQRQMKRSDQTRIINDLNHETTEHPNLLNVNIMSVILIVASLLALILFFSSSPVEAQENTLFSPGTSGNNDAIFGYLIGAINAVRDNDYDLALLFLDAATEDDPNFAPAYITRSFIALNFNDTETALSEAEIAYTLNPLDAAVYFVLAEAQFALGNYNSAYTHYQTYLTMVEHNGYQPILITSLLNNDSLPIVVAHLNICMEESAS